jgi:hypothetical protein
MTQYQATQQLHETVQAKAKELGLKVEITGDYQISEHWENDQTNGVYEYFVGDGEWYRGIKTQTFEPTTQDIGDETIVRYVSIREPQLKQIFLAFEEKLGENPVSRSFKLGADMWVHSKGKRKDCEVAYERYYFLPKSQAEAIYQKYCYDYPESGFKKDPVKALLEVNEIIKNLK